MRRLAASLAVLATIAGACATEESAGGSTSAALDATTTPSTSAAPSTTSAPTTTVAAETTTTTEAPAATPPPTAAPTTTQPPPSGEPVSGVVTYFAGSDTDAWLYLGRWTGSGWEQALGDDGTPVQVEVGTGSEITISRLGAAPAEGTVGALAESCFDGRQGPVITPTATSPTVPGFGYGAIALRADWPLRPRRVVELEDPVESLVTAGRSAFSDTSADLDAGSVDQIVVADLDGDGDTEVLIEFGAGPDDGSPGFGYSGIVLVDADSGSGTTVRRSVGVPTPSTTEVAGTSLAPPPPTFESFRVLDVVDLNGDGVMEVVVRSWYSEGAGIEVITYDGTTVDSVLRTGCGA